MRVPVRPLLALALAGAAVAAPAAQATWHCVGPSEMYFCVSVPTATVGSHTECVYTGGTTCKNVTIPWVTTSGSVDYGCGGDAWTCTR